MVFNGKPTRKWLSREYTPSPTASLKAIFKQKNWCVWGTRYNGSGYYQIIHPYQHFTKERWGRNGNHENNRCDNRHASRTG